MTFEVISTFSLSTANSTTVFGEIRSSSKKWQNTEDVIAGCERNFEYGSKYLHEHIYTIIPTLHPRSMPFNPTSPVRLYPRNELAMPPPTASSTPDTILTGSTLVGSASDASRVTRQTILTSNSGGRARQSWRNSISSAVGSLRRSNTTTNPARLAPISAPIRRLSVGTTNDSPTDPLLIPSGSCRPIELPASPVADSPITKPDEPQSFLDLNSDDSSDDGRPYSQPIITRANSVRVQRPKLVDNHPGDTGSYSGSEVTIQIYNGDLLQTLRPVPTKNVSRPMSTHREHAEESTERPQTPKTETTNESTRGMGPEHAYKALTANAPSSQLHSRFSATTTSSLLQTLSNDETVDSTAGLDPEAALKALTGAKDDVSTTALAPTPESQDASWTTVLAPTPPQHFTKNREEVPYPVYDGISLHSEAIIGENDIFGQPVQEGSKIIETIIETPNTPTTQSTLPSPFGGFGAMRLQKGRGSFSPLSMNPVDVDAARLYRTISAPSLPNHHLHRKVTIRPSDLVITDSRGSHKLFRDQVVTTPYPTRMGSIANPEEALAEKKVLAIVDKKSDRFPSPNRAEVLVLQLAAARHAGMKKTVAIDITDKGTFDDEQLFKDIQKAYRADLVGPARRVFCARRLSHATFSHDTTFDAEDFCRHLKDPKIGRKRKGWLFWLRQYQPIVSDSPQDRNRDNYASYYSPSSIPRMPFQRSLPQPPKVILHFEFSVLAIALAVLVCLLFSCLASVLWVLVGVSSFDAGAGLSERNWRHDAEGRVLTGLVLGMMVLSLSSLGSAVWIGGSYVLL